MMSHSKYEINPIKATLMKYKDKGCGIQAINDTCFGICGAFSGTTDVWNMDPNCTKACESLVNSQRILRYGVGKCDHQAPQRPVLWDQVPHYFPDILNKGASPQQAKQLCKKKCHEMIPGNDECIEKCETDFNAVVEPFDNRPRQRMNFDKYEKNHPAAFWIAFSVIVAAVIAIVVMGIRALRK